MASHVHPSVGKAAKDNTRSEVVGNYRLDKIVGQGTYGKVRAAYRLDTGEKVAVKVIDKSRISSEKHVARIQREIRFLKLMSHPNIVKVYDVIENDGFIYIAMEYAKGGELFDYIVANKRLKDQEARIFFRQIISAVDYMHENSVIHRDLKPENLLLDENNTIKIIDFGFGNNYKNDVLLDTFCGSPFYASPEMVLGKKYNGPEVDVWSLGVILFALLCGYLPFDDENVKILYKRIATANYKTPSFLSPESKHLIARMIVADPKQRATMEEIKNHPWVLETFGKPPANLVPERPVLQVAKLNKEIVRRLSSFGYQPEAVYRAFEDTTRNPAKNTYYLLSEMLQKSERVKKEEQKRRSSTPGLHQLGDSSVSMTGSSQISLSSYALDNHSGSYGYETKLTSYSSTPAVVTKPLPMSIQSAPRFQSAPQLENSKPPESSPHIREVNGWFLNVSVTSCQTPENILQEIVRVLKDNAIRHHHDLGTFTIHGEEMTGSSDTSAIIRFEVEVCKVPKQQDLHGVHFRRVNGGLWAYKKLCSKLVQQLKV